jgi:dinuclear metal center YbgI/SA1388 family protein
MAELQQRQVDMHRDVLANWINQYLNSAEVTRRLGDPAFNGLQVEGKTEVTRVGAAVDAAQATFERAAEAGVDFLLVHHGLFWGKPLAVTGIHKQRLELLFRHQISLYASHGPLDAHPEVGNNAQLCQELGLTDLEPFGWGYIGRFDLPQSLSQVGDRLGQITGMQSLIHQGGPSEVSRIAVVSGAAAGELEAAYQAGCELIITGEPRHSAFHPTFELGMNAIYAGHYDTETFGVKALARKLEHQFGLEWVFLDHPSGL